MNYSIEKVATLIGAHRFGEAEGDVAWLLTDSRSLAFPETTLFFALRTPRGDGHRYLPDLYRRGVRHFVVDTLPEHLDDYVGANFLQVLSPLRALQRLAERHREEYGVPVIGVTGSNGKTMVKEWLYQILSSTRRVVRSPRSYNSQIGVPLSVWNLDEQCEVGIFEAGISAPGEMSALRAIIQPTIGVMTNIGEAHQENFSTIEEKCREKLSLFQDAEVLVYTADDPVLFRTVTAMHFSGRQLAWSTKDPTTPLYLHTTQKGDTETRIGYTYNGKDGEIVIPFVDDASLTCAIHCLAVALYIGVESDILRERMAGLEPIAMRLEVKQGVRGCTLISDAYNSDINALDIALDFARRRPGGHERVLILSDILQSGLAREELYRRVADLVAHRSIDYLIGVGPEISAAGEAFSVTRKAFFPSVEALLSSSVLEGLSDSLILLKGARPAGFERLVDRLSQKVHETTLEVDLGAVADNLGYYRTFLRPETKITCMVKASAYGTGSVEVARTLQDRGVDYLAVAVADEGVTLREAGITADILIMNPEMSSFSTLFAYGLQPEVYSFGLLEALIHAAEREGITHFPIHIKLDTGMHRLGFDPEHDMEALIDRLRHQTALLPRSVFSHFVGSDSGDFDAFTREQFARYDAASRALQGAFSHRVLRHICNSAGIERFPEYHLDMVRLGLGLYGIDPIDGRELHNVATLKTTILQIRQCAAGDSVGYSRRTVLDRPSRIAALPIGYADGLDRHLGNRHGYCLVGGHRAPYVGNICMDVCMIDVTDIPCREGDSVEIFGAALPPTTLAEQLGTIPYEVLTSVSERVKRLYLQA